MEKEFKTIEHERPWRYQTDDGLTVTRGSAWSGPGCHLGCGVLMYTDENGSSSRWRATRRTPSTRAACACAALT